MFNVGSALRMKLTGPRTDLKQIERKFHRAVGKHYWLTTSGAVSLPGFQKVSGAPLAV
jgi:hypothetical protein